MKLNLTCSLALLGLALLVAPVARASIEPALNFEQHIALFCRDIDATQLVNDSVALTPQQKAKIQAMINDLRAAGKPAEADALQAALNAGKIRMGDPSQMGSVAMVATMTGYIIINEDLFNRDMNTLGGRSIVESQLLHEALHLRQFDLLKLEMATSSGGGYYNVALMELEAYKMQLWYLERELNALSPNDTVRRNNILRAIQRIKKLIKLYEAMWDAGHFVKVKPESFEDRSPWANNPPPRRNQSTMTIQDESDKNHTIPGDDSSAFLQTHKDLIEANMFAETLTDVPLAMAVSIMDKTGTVPDYDLKTWTDQSYVAHLGPSYLTDWKAGVDYAKNDPYLQIRTNPPLIGRPFSQVPAGIPIFIISDPRYNFSYGWDRNGDFVRIEAPV